MNGDEDIQLTLLLEAIYAKYHYDFRAYSLSSVRRRVAQAMIHFDIPNISSLQERLFSDPNFFSSLLQWLTIPTSEMFRDPTYYQGLRDYVIPLLKTYASLKVWVAGCSRGEEIYSLAILFEEQGLLDKTIIYATDINPKSLESAERGIYSADMVPIYTKNYQAFEGKRNLSDYYTAAYDGIVMEKRLRKSVVFADHSLATDSVFSEMHLISCRNVLIYFDRSLQDRALNLFYDSLGSWGVLGLGSKETVRFSKFESKFLEIVPQQRIFQKVLSI